MNKILRTFTVTAAFALFAQGTALAAPILVDPDEAASSVSIDLDGGFCLGCWADYEYSGSLNADEAMLDIGDSWTFDFFDIIVGGFLGYTGATVEATLGFVSPAGLASGIGTGGFGTLFGFINGGILTWDQPDNILLGDGSWLTIAFGDIHEFGIGDRATVTATVSRHGAVAVPEPGTLGLLGLGLLGVAFARKKVAA